MAKRVTEPSFTFWFPSEVYTVTGVESVLRSGTKDDISTLRSEYTRMRDVAQKRIKRLEKEFPDSKAAQHFYNTGKKDLEGNPIYAQGFQKLRNLTDEQLPQAFSELAKFVNAKLSTVTGQRERRRKTIETWNKQGLPLNEENYDVAIDLLEELRKRKLVYGSDKVVELADIIIEYAEDDDNEWLEHLDVLITHLDDVVDAIGYYNQRGESYSIPDMIKEFGW